MTTTPPKVPSSTPGPEIQVEGVVTEGVEAGCLVLDAGQQQYLLLGGDRAVLRPGARVMVTGRTDADLVSYCMQGVPLAVTAARPAG